MVNDDAELARHCAADGVHLSAAALARCQARPDFAWVGASCHNAAEIAVNIAADAYVDASEASAEVSEMQEALLDAVTEVAEEELATEEPQDTVTIVVEEKPSDDEPERSHWLTRPYASWKK